MVVSEKLAGMATVVSLSKANPKIILFRVATGQGKVGEIQGQGKVREFCNWSGKFGILRKVREFCNWSGKFDFLMSYAQ